MMTRFLSGLMSLGMCSVCLANPTIYYDLWRNTSNDVASATCIKMGLTDEDVPFHDTPTAAGEYFYWVRAVHTDERESNPVGDTVWVETCGTAGVGASVRLIYPTAASDTYPTSRVPVRLELWAFNNWECGAEWDFEILLYEDDLDGEDLIAIWPVTVEVSPSFTPSLIASAWVLEDLWQYEEYVPVFNETLELGARIRFAGETESETTAPMNVALLGSVAGPALDAFPGTTGIDLAWSAVSGNTGYSTVASAVWTFDDCNDNGIPDAQDIADCTGEPWCGDCNNNEVPDGCDIDAGTSQDVNGNGVPDECEADCNDNGIPDAQDIADCTGEPWCGDCNNNEVPDGCDIDAGTSQDVNGNGVPDECEADCNDNGIPDAQDIADCTGEPWCGDCNNNEVPDGCDIDAGTSQDVNGNGVPDECEADCNDNGIPDAQDIADCTGEPWCGDCNNNEVPDGCDIDAGTSQDVNGNGVPDECEADCNDNGIPDAQDIADCTGEPWCGDCNNNEVPDGCDIDAGTSQDVNGNGVPDECEADCNSNGIPDECDVDCSLPGCDAFGDCGQVPDINHNDIPDDCEDRTWRVRNPADHPTGRWSAAMTYDSHRRVHVLFGGRIGSTNIDETWEWNGVTWQQHAAAPGDRHPSARFTHAMAYDPSRRRIVLFGGTSGLDNPLRDTWEWDGARWHSFEISGVWPAARRSPNLAFVPNRGTVVLLGGYDARDTWEWNGQSWSHLANAQAVLIDRRAHGFAYDNLRNRGVLFGGNPNKKHDTWEFDVPNLHWALVSTTGPTGREGPAMAYDTVHKGCVLFGGHGTTYYNDTWEWDGAVWTPLTPASSPSGRYNHVMSYDQHRGVIVLFSGYGAPADTWEFGIPPAKGDRDHDGDFDLVDFAGFQACFAGEGVAGAGSECDVFDFEPDGDVDIADFTAFESAMNGPE